MSSTHTFPCIMPGGGSTGGRKQRAKTTNPLENPLLLQIFVIKLYAPGGTEGYILVCFREPFRLLSCCSTAKNLPVFHCFWRHLVVSTKFSKGRRSESAEAPQGKPQGSRLLTWERVSLRSPMGLCREKQPQGLIPIPHGATEVCEHICSLPWDLAPPSASPSLLPSSPAKRGNPLP